MPSASHRLKERGRQTWERAVQHPMVAGIGSGTLPAETFRGYFEQNVLYLEDYARAIGQVIARCPDREGLAVLGRFLAQITETEIPANLAFLQRLGGEPPADPLRALRPAAYAYTRHLLDVTARYDAACGLAAVLPCQWSYGEIGQRLLAAELPGDPVCADWIRMFAADSYDDLVTATTGLLDRWVDADDRAADRLSAIFDRSVCYEILFWDMAYAGRE